MGNVAKKRVAPYVAGCDRRRHGKAYLVTDTGRWLDQYSLSYFLYDPPIHYTPEDEKLWGLCDQGVSYVEAGGVWHAQTIVGRGHVNGDIGYYNAADILMEIQNGWASALAPLQGDQVRLLEPGGKSRRLIFHRGGWIHNYQEYRQDYRDLHGIQECMLPKGSDAYKRHIAGEEMCASLHWQHVEGGTKRIKRLTTRRIGELTYEAYRPIEGHPPQDDLALVAWLPIDEIHIVDNEDMQDKSPVAKALEFLSAQTSLPIFITDN